MCVWAWVKRFQPSSWQFMRLAKRRAAPGVMQIFLSRFAFNGSGAPPLPTNLHIYQYSGSVCHLHIFVYCTLASSLCVCVYFFIISHSLMAEYGINKRTHTYWARRLAVATFQPRALMHTHQRRRGSEIFTKLRLPYRMKRVFIVHGATQPAFYLPECVHTSTLEMLPPNLCKSTRTAGLHLYHFWKMVVHRSAGKLLHLN